MAGGGAGLGGWEDGGRGGVGYALAPRDCPARARPPGGRGHAGGGARGAGRVFSRRVPSQVRLPPRRRVRAGSSPTPPPDRPRRASGRPVINLLGRALHDGHVTTRSTSPGQPRRSPMLNFATKTLQTGANGQNADGTSPFVSAVLKKLSWGESGPGRNPTSTAPRTRSRQSVRAALLQPLGAPVPSSLTRLPSRPSTISARAGLNSTRSRARLSGTARRPPPTQRFYRPAGAGCVAGAGT